MMSEPSPSLPADRGHLPTEQRLSVSADLDSLSIADTLTLINAQDATVAEVVRQAIPRITPLVDAAVQALRADGRLIYLGAGTSGRLGVLDASEIPPTFHCPPGKVIGIIAGGDSALRQSSEGREDDPQGAHVALQELQLHEHDVVVGIAAGGTTPYVLGALALAKSHRCRTALMTCIPESALPSVIQYPRSDIRYTLSDIDFLICLPVGAEVLTGSTRMKAGTATKLALNMISTTLMVQLGKAWGNLMVDVRATNAKLRDRAARILMEQCRLSRAEAFDLLDRAEGQVKLALVMHRRKLSTAAAAELLAQNHGHLRPILGNPR